MSAAPSEVADEREITEVLHFTTEKGVMGSLQAGTLLSRERVQQNEDLAFIFTSVWPRRDPEWVDYVSLSITRINSSLYQKAAKHLPDLWWAVMSFSPAILDDPDVVFTTTNNVYDEVCERGEGVDGLEAMFKDRVPYGYYGSVKTRSSSRAKNLPTDLQAEVLYPEGIDLSQLQLIYVGQEQHRSLILAWCDVLGKPEPTVQVAQDLFT